MHATISCKALVILSVMLYCLRQLSLRKGLEDVLPVQGNGTTLDVKHPHQGSEPTRQVRVTLRICQITPVLVVTRQECLNHVPLQPGEVVSQKWFGHINSSKVNNEETQPYTASWNLTVVLPASSHCLPQGGLQCKAQSPRTTYTNLGLGSQP